MKVQASRRQQGESGLTKMLNGKSGEAIIGLVITFALCIAYYINFRSYHASLEKLDKLTTLFHNPNARVASGEQGKRILKKIGITTEKEIK